MRETLMENNILPAPQRKVRAVAPHITPTNRLAPFTHDRPCPPNPQPPETHQLHQPTHAQHFMKLFARFLESRSRPPIDWKQVEPIDPALVVDFERVPPCPEDQVRGLWGGKR